jgi:hypothetical protein
LLARIQEDYRYIILFIAVHVQMEDNIVACGLATLSVKSVNCDKRKKGVNRQREKAGKLLGKLYAN